MDSPEPSPSTQPVPAPQMRRRFRATLRLKIALSAVTVLMCLGVTELGLRARRMAAIMKDKWWGPSVIIHRKSADPVLVYELTPNSRAKRENGEEIVINAQGFRDDPFPEPPPADARRIVVIGDSVAFGWGVPMEAAFPQLLEAQLNQQFPAIVYNLAVDGYSTTQEVRMLELRGLALKPDLIIVAYVLNDPDDSYDAGLARYFKEPGIELIRPISDALWNIRQHFESSGKDTTDYSARVHRRYHAQIENNFRRLGEIAKSTGTPILIAILPAFQNEGPHPEIAHDLKSLAAANGLAALDLSAAFLAEGVKKNGSDNWYPGAKGELPPDFAAKNLERLSFDIWHPKPEGHAVIANALAEEIVKMPAKEKKTE